MSDRPMRWFDYVRSYYKINRRTWPDLGRVRSLISAWKCGRGTSRQERA